MKSCIKNMRKSNRILFIISSLGTGGAERVVSELANYFCNKNNKVSILLLSRNDISYELNKNIKIIYGSNQINGKNRISDFFLRINLIRKYIRLIQPNITISFLSTINIYSCLAIGFSKNKLIVSERNDPKKSPSERIKRLVRNIVYYLSDGYVFQTNEARNYFYSKIKNKGIVISNPIKPNLPDVYIGERTKRIVAVGRLEAQKNYPLLIKAFYLISNEFKDYIVEIYGEGQERSELSKLINELNLNNRVLLMGRHSDVHERIKDASLYVLSSDYEGMPNALMEAMALGLPCIATNCSGGGPKTLITNGVNGILVSIDDEVSLSTQMAFVLQNNQIGIRLSKKASLVRDEYSIDIVGSKWLDYITKIVGSNNRWE
ncbi:MAG TPA: glycosyltransferase family 4 protein [Acholeplasmataceae bacterium]|nr:glycosyltransferase family 4 protein [Acholeplasmataceae bacterium]